MQGTSSCKFLRIGQSTCVDFIITDLELDFWVSDNSFKIIADIEKTLKTKYIKMADS